MNQEQANFLRANINLVDRKDFTELYRVMNKPFRQRDMGSITEFFLSLNINPLLYMETVPECFAYESGITSITIPDGITSIGKDAFDGCTKLKNVTIPDSVTNIGDYAFYECYSLTNITIPDNVTSIGKGAFGDCKNLINITIPNSVIGIGVQAFWSCAKLTNIRYMGSKEGWKNIFKKPYWDKNTGDYIVHCTDGDIHKGETL